MNLSNTSQYAIRVVSYMALNKDQIFTASTLINKMNVSDKYLKRILTTLTANNILESIQGRYGGFRLAKDQDDIYLIDIVSAMENIEKYFGCVLGFDKCSDENPCALHNKWGPIINELKSFLTNTTISDVISNDSINSSAMRI